MSIKYLSPQIRRSTGRRTSRSRSFRNDRSNHRRLRLVHQTDGESTGYDLQRETVRTKSLLCLSSGMCSEFTRSEFRPWMCLFRSDQCFVFFCFVFFNYYTFQVNPIRILDDTKVEKHCFRYYYHNVKPPINLLKRTKSWPPLELTCLGFFFCLESSRLQGSICSRNTCRRLDRRAGPEDFWTRPSVCPRLPGCPTGEQHRFVSFLLLHWATVAMVLLNTVKPRDTSLSHSTTALVCRLNFLC